MMLHCHDFMSVVPNGRESKPSFGFVHPVSYVSLPLFTSSVRMCKEDFLSKHPCPVIDFGARRTGQESII